MAAASAFNSRDGGVRKLIERKGLQTGKGEERRGDDEVLV